MTKDLHGKVAVVTGATHGLGKAIVHELAGLGADLVLIARDPGRLAETQESLPKTAGETMVVSCDLSNADQVRRAARNIVAKFDKVDILVNNAGIPAPRSVAETSFADWDQVIGTNLSGVFYLTRALWSALLASDGGYVINISGTSGLRGSTSPAYASAKFGLTGLTRAIASCGREHNVRATALYPGAMDTGWRGSPIGKPRVESMDPQEIARYVAYLLTTPKEFVINESVLNPIGDTWQ